MDPIKSTSPHLTRQSSARTCLTLLSSIAAFRHPGACFLWKGSLAFFHWEASKARQVCVVRSSWTESRICTAEEKDGAFGSSEAACSGAARPPFLRFSFRSASRVTSPQQTLFTRAVSREKRSFPHATGVQVVGSMQAADFFFFSVPGLRSRSLCLVQLGMSRTVAENEV